jgi:hypothetical protein
MRLMLDHPAADAAAMMMIDTGVTTHMSHKRNMYAAQNGNLEAMRLLLDHPSADAAAMMAARSTTGTSALMAAVWFAAGLPAKPARVVPRSCAPLLLLLRRVAVESQPSDVHKAHMTEVMEELCPGPRWNEMFGSDQPDDARDECVRMLLERGASYPRRRSPVVSRIIQECVQLARVPQLLNEAVVGVAIARQSDLAAWNGHPSADPAAMIVLRSSASKSALLRAAGFASGTLTSGAPTRSCAPLLLLLRRVTVESQPCAAQQAHMSKVVEALCEGPRSNEIFGSDQPDEARDECVRMLLERGASHPRRRSPVVSRIIQEYVQLARVPQLVNEAVVSVAHARQQEQTLPPPRRVFTSSLFRLLRRCVS